jgi:tetratricopeptide (TPR) repeat protein
MDIVAYSTLPMDEQQKLLLELQTVVRATSEFVRAQASHQLIRLPTGDGMALVFFRDPEAAVRCALQLGRALRHHPEIRLRMGIHSGPVYRVADINANRNVSGGGINIAQRVMDCGDAGHILVSEEVAKMLGQLSEWRGSLQDLGEAEVKHGVRLHLFNLRTEDAGNPEMPHKLRAVAISRKPTRRWPMLVSAAAAAALTVAGILFFYTHKAHALSETDTVVLADFANSTGDTVFDGTLRQGLAVQLEQSPFLSLISEQRIQQTLRLMGQPADAKLTPEIARDLCQRTGSAAVLDGSIASLGSQYVLSLNAVNCRTGDTVAHEQVQAARKENVLKALDLAATKLRKKLGESLSSIQKFDTPVEQATTTSFEALKAYSLAMKIRSQKGDAAAVPLYKRAIELDANFASTYDALGIAYSNLQESGLASKNIQKAYELQDRVSEREKLRIVAHYYTFVTGDVAKANQAYEVWVQTYPRDKVPRNNLGVFYDYLGQYEKAATLNLEALRLDPDEGILYGNLMGSYCNLNRIDEAKGAYQQALARKLDNPFLHFNMYVVAFLQGDTLEMERQVASGAGKPGVEDVFLSAQSDTEAFFGHLGAARELSRRAVESAQRADEKESAALWQTNAALREAEFGNSGMARQDAAAALAIASTRDVQILSGLALARAGDSTRAQALADNLAQRLHRGTGADSDLLLNTVIDGYWLPTIRAAIEVSRNKRRRENRAHLTESAGAGHLRAKLRDEERIKEASKPGPAKAIELLQAAAPYELGEPPPDACRLYAVYVRGQAYLLLGLGNAAAAEFQRFLVYRGIVANCPLGVLAHVGLARAYALQGDTAKARAAYNDFLTLWKDADPEIPILRAAKSEYAKLQ